MKEICVVGLGYIGLPTAIFFADKGYKVYGYDINEEVVSSLQEGHIHIEEEGLTEKYYSVLEEGRLSFSIRPTKADIFMIAVPTPLNGEKRADLSYVESAVNAILPYIHKNNLIIIESTIPPKTVEERIVPILQKSGYDPKKNEVYLAYCPERVIPGNILSELSNNDRIAGGYTEEAAEEAANLFTPNIKGKVYKTSAINAEMIKLMENTYRDVNIALANELALISEELGVDVHEVIELANKHPRVHMHEPGPGVGGHCIPIDPYFVIEKAHSQTPLMQTARKINENMPYIILEQIEKLQASHRIEKIAVLGLSYKGNVSDTRESAALKIAQLLVEKGFKLKAHDPYVHSAETGFPLYSLEESLEEADLALVLVDHREYSKLTNKTFRKMRNKVVFDTKNCLQENEGITLYKLGQKKGNINRQVRI